MFNTLKVMNSSELMRNFPNQSSCLLLAHTLQTSCQAAATVTYHSNLIMDIIRPHHPLTKRTGTYPSVRQKHKFTVLVHSDVYTQSLPSYLTCFTLARHASTAPAFQLRKHQPSLPEASLLTVSPAHNAIFSLLSFLSHSRINFVSVQDLRYIK